MYNLWGAFGVIKFSKVTSWINCWPEIEYTILPDTVVNSNLLKKNIY